MAGPGDYLRGSQPLHRKLDVLGLKLAPAFDLGLIPVLRVFFEVSPGELSRERLLLGELLSDEGIFRVFAPPDGDRFTRFQSDRSMLKIA